MQRVFNLSNIYILLWCLYFLQGVIYTSGGIVSRTILFFLVAVSAIIFVYTNIVYRLPVVLYVLDVLICVFTIYGVSYWLSGEINSKGATGMSYLKVIYMSLLPIYSFYSFTRKDWLTEKSLKIWALVFLGVAIVSYFYNQEQLLDELASYEAQDGVTNNVGYVMVALLPLSVLFRKRPIIQYLYIGICLGFTLFGMKRGAILTGGICVLWLIFKSFTMVSLRQKIVISLLTLIMLVALFYGLMYLMNTSDYFAYRISQTESGASSGRDVLYRNAIHYLLNLSDSRILLFGSGAHSTINLLGNYAHNDWLEILINNGIFTAVIYFIYWVTLAAFCVRNRKRTLVFLVLTLFFIIGFLKTLFSMSYNDIPIYLSSIVGFVLAIPSMTRLKSHKKVMAQGDNNRKRLLKRKLY